MNLRALVAEFIGTFALIFIGVGSIAAVLGQNGGLAGIALAHGLTIACLASALGAISGGHFNPAVSLGLAITGKLSAINLIGYWVAQVVGALVGALAIAYLVPGKIDAIGGGVPSLDPAMDVARGAVAEGIGTFFLVLVIFGTAVDRRAPKMGGLFIGLTITFVALAIGPLTGASINPARYLGPAIVAGNFANAAMYIGAALGGGALAALVYMFVFGEKETAATPAT